MCISVVLCQGIVVNREIAGGGPGVHWLQEMM